jgi:hypothetical protein
MPAIHGICRFFCLKNTPKTAKLHLWSWSTPQVDFAISTFGVKKCTFGVENSSLGGLFLLQTVIYFHK